MHAQADRLLRLALAVDMRADHAEQQEMRVFKPFSGCHSSQGGGLGLTICAEIADAIGAQLSLRNRKRAASEDIAGLDASVRFGAGGFQAG
ncbi:two-component system, OmpR family, sensor histidine kinase TctE [Janthinobacterium psychrotolerans]|uniref:Two-component system, OmpR family, sensor histidine kinase TctE n=1 Tax=Janthinobacterium psychrotolerans TaxID=1747903 RepID=A0A1A7C5Y0_9BURK|nr:two-component system, OmpR family, sensor histidine kinase TctE [Janthinobacterium psychrotolerans]